MIVCVAGPIGAGKSTVAEILKKYLSEKYKCCAFADEIKNTICRTFGVDRDFIEKWKRINENPPGFSMPMRNVLQFIGEEFKKIKPGCWTDYLLNNNDDYIIISDGRRCEETTRIKKRNGKVILVWKPECDLEAENSSELEVCETVKSFLPQFFNRTFIKANFVNHVDFFIKNDKSKEDLELEIKNLLPKLSME